MIDLEIYNERRQQLIDNFGEDLYDFIFVLGTKIEDLVDNLEWEDNEALAETMGWTETST